MRLRKGRRIEVNYLRLVVCDEFKWQEFVPGKKSFDVRRNNAHKYMVLCQLLEGLYRMFEFEQIDDAVHHASATRTHLQELRASQQMGLPESVQVFAFTLTREWNPENQPGADMNPFGLKALRGMLREVPMPRRMVHGRPESPRTNQGKMAKSYRNFSTRFEPGLLRALRRA